MARAEKIEQLRRVLVSITRSKLIISEHRSYMRITRFGYTGKAAGVLRARPYGPGEIPDLNSIEHVWDTLGQRLKEHQPIQDLQHVEAILMELWKQLDPQYIRRLVESMPRRCAEVLRFPNKVLKSLSFNIYLIREIVERLRTTEILLIGKSTRSPEIVQKVVEQLEELIEENPHSSLRRLSALTVMQKKHPLQVPKISAVLDTGNIRHLQKIYLMMKVLQSQENFEISQMNASARASVAVENRVSSQHKVFEFTGPSNVNEAVRLLLENGKPFDLFKLLINNDILDSIVEQTNLFATQRLTKPDQDTKSFSRLHKWIPTTRNEIKKLFGIFGYMGLVKMPTLQKY
ncbi:hypothetical protein TcasGA2_TC010697 [Tribolium castaneum]|uniref:PiggyBac transposable element-derived protein domain-containing protein n=1 Tax=Tribolium castaneum TaxID=7070 RepID=D2CG32_TRICA|nr:hypothetical protein TcasGA2_TC010697 [Tribolium castaneum]